MIKQSPKKLRAVSKFEGMRIVDHPNGLISINGGINSVTLCKYPITEIDRGICQSSKISDIKKACKDKIDEGNLTQQEIKIVKKLFKLDQKKTLNLSKVN